MQANATEAEPIAATPAVAPSQSPATSAKAGSTTQDRYVFIDFLRGIAALLVAFFHFQIHGIWRYPAQAIPPDSITYRFIWGNFGMGVYGVALFFIISGYLIPSTLETPNASVRRFAIHRFFRLYPAYWLSIPGVLLYEYLRQSAVHPTGWQIVANITMLQGYLRQNDLMGVYWTLQIEVTFYVLCALLFYFRKLDRRETVFALSMVGAVACAAVRHVLERKLPVALFLALTLMFLGDIVRHASRDAKLRARVPGYVALTLVVLVPTCWLAYGPAWKSYTLSYWAGIGSFLLANYFAHGIQNNRWLNGLSTLLGETSYGVYLFHSLVGGPILFWMLAHGYDKVTSMVSALVSTTVFSVMLFRWFERPFIELGRKVASRRRAVA